MHQALIKHGFDENNKEHILISLGDIFDRGNQNYEMYEYLKNFPKDRKILIRGNHEYLLQKLLRDKEPKAHDFSNGTVNTVMEISDALSDKKYWKDRCDVLKLISDWIDSDEWVNYYELDRFIFVHSFIPVRLMGDAKKKYAEYPPYRVEMECVYNGFTNYLTQLNDFRECKAKARWETATWGCPYVLFEGGLFDKEVKKGKVLVCGHWSASDFHEHYEGIEDNNNIFNGANMIALDGKTPFSHHVNVLVLEEKKDGKIEIVPETFQNAH